MGLDTQRLGARGHAGEMLIVARQDRRAARLEPFEDLGLGVGDLGHRIEELDMDRFDRW